MNFLAMPASKKYLHPEAIRRIARMELRARTVVEGVLAGLHKSPFKGQSVEFLQHREYVRGTISDELTGRYGADRIAST